MIKDFKNFVKESVQNKGVGPGNKDLLTSAPKKQTINRSIPTMDFLRVGKHIQTSKIDGFIDSVQNESIFITDRISGEIKKYTLKEVLKEIAKSKDIPLKSLPVEGFTGTPKWAEKPKLVKESKKINSIRVVEDDEDDTIEEDDDNTIEDKDLKKPSFMNTIVDDIYGNILENYSSFDDEDEQLVGDTYNPGMSPNEDEQDQETLTEEETEEWNPGEEEREQAEDRLRGTEDNPTGINRGIKREIPNESWTKYWEKFNETQRHLIEDEDEITEVDDEEDIEEEDEVPNIVGNESNPIEARRRRTTVEEYSEENPEPMPNDVSNEFDDDRYDQFGK